MYALSWHFTLQNGVTAVDIAVPGILNFLSKGMYKILLDASGLTEQEHKVFIIQWNPSNQDTSPTILTLFVAPNATFVCL